MPPATIGIVLVAYNNAGHLRRCVESIRRSSYPHWHIIIIDNSTLPSEASSPPEGERIHYRKMGDNLGFCRACNVGLAISKELAADYTLMLNFDTVLREDALANMIARAGALPDLGILGGKILYQSAPDRIWYAGGSLSRLSGVGKHHGYNEKDGGGHDAFAPVTYVTGCCMLVPTPVFVRLGGFKESLFMYLDDAEFCLRMLAAGLKLYYEPSVVLYHAVGPGMERYGYPEYYLYFTIRNKPNITSHPGYALYLRIYVFFLAAAKAGFYGLHPKVRRRGRKVRAILWGLMDSFSPAPRYRDRFPRMFSNDAGGPG